jgi:hypothetical protein
MNRPGTDMRDLDVWEQYHGRRYRFLIDTIRDYYEPGMKIAVFGAALETPHIKKEFPLSTVDSYGIRVPPFDVSVDDLIELDLNSPIRIWKRYDIGVCAEVVEHLTRPFADVLGDMLRCCRIVIIQTPNARMLCGRLRCMKSVSPYQYVKERFDVSGHVHEYTLKELTEGFPVIGIYAKNYTGGRSLKRALYNLVCWCLPVEFRDGFTIVYYGRA